MRIGLFFTTVRSSTPDALDRLRDSFRTAADDGFPSVWLSNIFDIEALTAIAVAGSQVPGIELGTAVVPSYPRHPAALAQQALTVDLALGGRLALGIGLSHQIVIEQMFGYDYAKPARHMREYLSILGPLLRGEKAEYSGETLSADLGYTIPVTRPIPLLVAALGPRMLEIAGTMADGTVLWMTGPKTVTEHVAPTITGAARAAGRPAPRIVCALPTCVTDDEAGARGVAAEVFARYGELPSYRAMLDREGAPGPGDVAIVGDEDSVTAQLDALAKAGVTDFVAADFMAGRDGGRTRSLLKTLL